MASFSLSNGLSCETIKRQPKISFHMHFKGPIRLQGCETLSFHWIREAVQIKVVIVRLNFPMNISEQFTIRECVRPSFVI